MIYAVILMDRNQTVDLAPRFAKIGAKVYEWRRQVYPAPLTHVYFVSSNPKLTPKWWDDRWQGPLTAFKMVGAGKGHSQPSALSLLS